MISTTIDTIVTGAAFGAALVASGMYSPYLVASQFSFENWNMMQTFLTATACSALILEILQQLGLKVPLPRSYSPIGLLGTPLDGNIIGGAILGAGMSLSASCPGMVFPQLATGVPSAPMTAVGAVAGGIFWSAVLRPRIVPAARRQQQQPPTSTLAELAGTGRTVMFLIYEAALTILVAAAALKAPSAPSVLHPVVGGLAIGGAQLASLSLRGSLLGVSACYEQLGDWVVYYLSPTQDKGNNAATTRPATSSLVFPGAMMVGARLLVWVMPEWTLASAAMLTMVTVSPLRAFVGGFLMAVGSRVGGGCTSGHGISGMALMSLSSFVTMFAAFAAAMVVSLCL